MALGQVGSMAVALLGDINDFTKKMDTATGKVSAFDKGVEKMGKAVTKAAKAAAVAAAAAVTAYGVSAVKTFADFDTNMRQVFTLMPDLSAEAKDVMIEDVMELSDAIDILPSEIIPALYQAISAGVPRENVFTYLEVAGEAAIGGAVELEGMVVALAQVMNAYGSEVDQARSYSDMFFSIIADGLTTMEELSTELFKVAPVAADVGIAFSGIAGWMAELTSQGVPAAEAASYMKVALNELSKAGTIASDTFEKAAGVTFPAFIASGGDIVDAFGIIDQYAQDSNISVKDMFGSIEAGGAVLMATGVHFDSFSEKVGNAEEAAGKTTDAYTEMAAGIQRELDGLAAWWERLKIDIGGDLTENLQDLLGWLEDNREAIGNGIKDVFETLIDSLEWMQQNGDTVKAVIVGIGLALGGAAIAANPLGAAIAAIVAGLTWIVAAAIDASKEIDSFAGAEKALTDAGIDLGNVLNDTTTDVEKLSSSLAGATDFIEALLTRLAKSGKLTSPAFASLIEEINRAKDAIVDLPADEALDEWQSLVNGILDEYGIIDPYIRDMFNSYVEIAGESFASAGRAAKESSRVIAEALSSERDALGGTADAMGQTAETARTTTLLIAESLEDEREAIVDTTSAWYIHAADVLASNRLLAEQLAEDQAAWNAKWKEISTSALSDMLFDLVTFHADSEASFEENQAAIKEIVETGFKNIVNSILESGIDTAAEWFVEQLWDMATEAELASAATSTALNTILIPLAAIAGLLVVVSDILSGKSTGVQALNKWLTDLIYGAGTYDANRDGFDFSGYTPGATIKGYAEGGVVPGPVGAPQMAIVHGGEPIGAAGFAEVLDYERLGNAVAAGVYDAMSEVGSNSRPINVYLPDGTKLAQKLYDPLQREADRRGGSS